MAGQAEEEVQEVAGGHGGRAALFPGSRVAVSDACPDASTSCFQGTGSPGIQLSFEIQISASISAPNIFGLPGPGEYEGRVKKQLFSFLEKSGMRTPLLRLA